MTTADQIKDFIENYNIEKELKNVFELYCKYEDIKIKNYKIEPIKIDYEKSNLGLHLFKTSIFKNEKVVGYLAIEYDYDFIFIDDFFVIFDEIYDLINKVAQNKINFEDGKVLILENEEYCFLEVFDILKSSIFNSIPNKSDYNSETYQNAIKSIPLKETFTPIAILSKYTTKIAFNKLRELPESEHSKIITSLLWIYKFTDTERRETECKNGCEHQWHNLK